MGRPEKPLVLGIGNVLLGDEGVGVHAVRKLQTETLPPNITVIDGGTGGFHLLSLFKEFNPIVLIDATMDDKPAGTVSVLRPRFASDFPRTLSAHDIGLRDLIESAALLAPLPPIHLVTISIDSINPMSLDLSPPVQSSIPKVIMKVREILNTEKRTG